MKISTEIASIAKYAGSYEKAIELVAQAGFDAFDCSMFDMARFNYATGEIIDNHSPMHAEDCLSYFEHLRAFADSCGIPCRQSHAPFPSYAQGMEPYILKALEATHIMGASICVVHPHNNLPADKNAEFFRRLLDTAKKNEVIIATENMWNRDSVTKQNIPAACSHHEDFLRHIELVKDPNLQACLDIGHAEMDGLNTSAVQMIHTLKDHLIALHIHDNDKHLDSHQIPFSMNIDWPPIIEALKEVHYSGYFTLEADQYVGSHIQDTPIEVLVQDLADAAHKLAQMMG